MWPVGIKKLSLRENDLIWNLIRFYVCRIIVTAFIWCLWAKRAFNTHICKLPHWFSFYNAAVWLWLLQILSGRGSESLSVAWLIQVSLMISRLYKAAIRLEDMKRRGTLSSKQAAKQLLISTSDSQSKVDCSWTILPYMPIKLQTKVKVAQLVCEIRENSLGTS